jgi:hypothetical protein
LVEDLACEGIYKVQSRKQATGAFHAQMAAQGLQFSRGIVNGARVGLVPTRGVLIAVATAASDVLSLEVTDETNRD